MFESETDHLQTILSLFRCSFIGLLQRQIGPVFRSAMSYPCIKIHWNCDTDRVEWVCTKHRMIRASTELPPYHLRRNVGCRTLYGIAAFQVQHVQDRNEGKNVLMIPVTIARRLSSTALKIVRFPQRWCRGEGNVAIVATKAFGWLELVVKLAAIIFAVNERYCCS